MTTMIMISEKEYKIIMIIVAIVVSILVISMFIVTFAFASHGNDTASCKNDGLYDGKNNPFSHELYKMCGDTYMDAFIEGCMSVGNTKDVCESATDAEG
jgi:hypothetical protein